MELKLNSGDVITIPDGCKAVIKDKTITVEKEVQEFKDGDFVASKAYRGKLLMIYNSERGNSSAYYHAATYNEYYENRVVSYNDWCFFYDFRIATDEEKQLLLDALHAEGKDWDADKKQIVDYKWKPKIGDNYYFIDCFLDVIGDLWVGDRMDDLVYTIGNCFKTKDEAKKYADNFSEILKDRKL